MIYYVVYIDDGNSSVSMKTLSTIIKKKIIFHLRTYIRYTYYSIQDLTLLEYNSFDRVC